MFFKLFQDFCLLLICDLFSWILTLRAKLPFAASKVVLYRYSREPLSAPRRLHDKRIQQMQTATSVYTRKQ
jgi:hypothetical protein